jgi:hypothetical protein
MEMNLYGVASINLDKMRGRTLKRYLIALAILYGVILLLGNLLPERIAKE